MPFLKDAYMFTCKDDPYIGLSIRDQLLISEALKEQNFNCNIGEVTEWSEGRYVVICHENPSDELLVYLSLIVNKPIIVRSLRNFTYNFST